MRVIGLTGPVASGKSFIASRLKDLKIPVFDADFQVHKLLSENQQIIDKIKKHFPKAVVKSLVDRKLLGKEVFNNPQKLKILENIIYPFLRQKEDEFLKKCLIKRKKIAVLNIPLLFEKGGFARCDANISISAPRKIRLNRFLKRHKEGNIDEMIKKFAAINQNQLDDFQRKKFKKHVLHSGLDKGYSVRKIKLLIKNICNV